MLIQTGMTTSNTGINQPMVEVPETGVYRSADNSESRFYRAGAMVSRHEFDLLQMGGDAVIGESAEPEAKAEPKPSNKAEPKPKNKAE